jgi:energy-coupling factor transporter transmembrane protein EcfT
VVTESRRRPRSLAAGGEVHLLRYVPGDSPIHRMWAGTKLVVAAVLSIGLVSRPTWRVEGVVWVVFALALALARVPKSALPRPPRWFAYGIALGGVLAVGSGGAPTVHMFSVALALGGLIEWLRFTLFGLLVLGMATLIGWTTPLADLPPALDRLYGPLRALRLPVDDLVMVIALSVRCVPLLIEEMRVLGAARRLRQPEAGRGWRARVIVLHDLLVTALVASLRRARDLAEALDARGGPSRVGRQQLRLQAVDIVAFFVAAAALFGILVV